MNADSRNPRRPGWPGAMAVTLLLALALLFLSASPIRAHCDTLDGPVAVEAKAALERGEVTGVLKWVGPGQEAAIREAFARTVEARAAGGVARDLADLWFLETLVRIHREGEGAPYTGLKPAGAPVAPGIAAADQALEKGTSEELIKVLAGEMAQGIRERFIRTLAKRRHAARSVSAGREYVAAYVDFIHYVEAVDAAATRTGAHGHGHSAGPDDAPGRPGAETPPAHEH